MNLPLERLEIRPMASGNQSLLLTEQVDWESFPTYAEAILQLVGGKLVDRADGPDQRVWTVRIGTQLFWLAYDEFPLGCPSTHETAKRRRWFRQFVRSSSTTSEFR